MKSPPGRGGAPPGNGAPTNVIALHSPHRTRTNRSEQAPNHRGTDPLADVHALLAKVRPHLGLAAGERIGWIMVDVESDTIEWGGTGARREAAP